MKLTFFLNNISAIIIKKGKGVIIMTTHYSYEASVTGTPALMICLCICIPLLVLMIVAHWRIYSKANEPGWASLVPFYNSYVMFKISNKKGLFWANLIFSILMIGAYIGLIILIMSSFWYLLLKLLLFLFGGLFCRSEDNYYWYILICGIIVFISFIVTLTIRIIQLDGLSKAFGKGGGFTVGLIFLYPIFICILGFSKNAQYIESKQNPYGQ